MRDDLIAAIAAAMLCGCGDSDVGSNSAGARAVPSLRFEEVKDSGITRSGESYGVTWGDIDGDGRADLYLNNHYDRAGASLYQNLGGGSFRDVASAWLPRAAEYKELIDRHAGLFADFDNDGDQDLLVAAGANFGTGAIPNEFFLNEGERFRECAQDVKLDYPLAPARTLLSIDLDDDGALDVICTARKRSDGTPMTAFFRQAATDPMSFEQLDTGLDMSGIDGQYGQVTYIDGHGLVLFSHGWPPEMLSKGTGSLRDLTEALGMSKLYNVTDTAWADFDGDGDLDLFYSTSKGATDFATPDARTVNARLVTYDPHSTKGLRIVVADELGRLKFRLFCPPAQLPVSDILIGAAKGHPDSFEFELDAGEASVAGVPEPEPGKEDGMCIGFDASERTWTVVVTSKAWAATQMILASSVDVVRVEPIGFERHEDAAADVLLLWDGKQFRNRSEEAGFVTRTNAHSVAAADFDNDMDVDLYVVTLGGPSNNPNVVYENLGGGRFEPRADANAAGTTVGSGDSVGTADFDGDGFLDLCVTNGEGYEPFFGPVQLFRNAGNSNHWLMVDLVGTRSNRDGIGARVRVTAGGVTQLRLQDGGVHKFSQNHARLHFGLGEHAEADRIVVDWPSGATQELTGVVGDRVLRIVEPQ